MIVTLGRSSGLPPGNTMTSLFLEMFSVLFVDVRWWIFHVFLYPLNAVSLFNSAPAVLFFSVLLLSACHISRPATRVVQEDISRLPLGALSSNETHDALAVSWLLRYPPLPFTVSFHHSSVRFIVESQYYTRPAIPCGT